MTKLDLVGKTLGRFEILSELGRGGMAVVYRARQTDLGRVVALKILPPELSYDKTYIARFLQEARSAAGLEHPHIVPIYEIGEADGLHYIAMKFIIGQTLKDLVHARGAMSLPETIALLDQMASALDYAHTSGVIHRDIKPSNMMVEQNGWVYLTDFGLARGGGGGSGLTATGMVMGTPEYMSPEQAQGLPNIGPPTDIYALGVVIYELITGNMPFQADTPMGMLIARLQYAPRPPRDYRADLPDPVEDVIMRALARRPESRYQSAGELLQALKVASGIPTGALHVPTRPISPLSGTPKVTTPLSGSPAPVPPGTPPPPARAEPLPTMVAGTTPLPPISGGQPTAGVPPISGRQPTVGVPPTSTMPSSSAGQPTTVVPPKKGNPMVIMGAVVLVVVLVLVGAFFAFRPAEPPRPTVNVEFQQANQAFERDGGLDDALSGYQAALAKQPDNIEARTRVAWIQIMRSNYPEAEQAARAAATGTKESVTAQALLAEALNGLYRYDEAARAADAAISLDPQHPSGYAARALVRADQGERESNAGRLNEALTDADKALELASDDLQRAWAQRARGIALWSQYIIEDDPALLDEANKAFEAAADAQEQLGLLHSYLGAMQNFYAYRAQDNDEQDQAEQYFDEAIKFFDQAQKLDPKLSTAHSGEGWAYFSREAYDDALNEFDQAISLSNRNVSAYIGKSRVLRDQDPPDYAAAAQALEQGIGVVQQDPQLYSTLGWLYLSQGFNADARADKIKHFNDAETQFRIALERNPRDVEALNGRGWALRALGDALPDANLYDEALVVLNESLSLRPRQFGASFGRGWAYYAQAKYVQAEAEFRSALDVRPADSGGYYWLGLSLIEQGLTDEAREALERAVELGSPFAQQELDNLR